MRAFFKSNFASYLLFDSLFPEENLLTPVCFKTETSSIKSNRV